MASRFRLLIAAKAPILFRVDQYPDVFERMAMYRWPRPLAWALLRHKVRPDVKASPIRFIHVPKNGGTSVKRVLYQSDPGHVSVRFYEMINPHIRASRVLCAYTRADRSFSIELRFSHAARRSRRFPPGSAACSAEAHPIP